MSQTSYRSRLKARMLQLAREILEADGLAGLQARRLAKEADCAVGSIYNIFNGIDGLIIAANTATLRDFGRNAEAAMRRSESGSVEDRLMALALAYLDFAIAHPKRLKAVFDHQMAEDAEVPTEYRADQDQLFALIEAPLRDVFADPKARAAAARAMFAAVHGIVVMALDRKLGPFDVKATEWQVRLVVQLIARGLPHVRIG